MQTGQEMTPARSVFITGGAGFIGSRVVEALLRKGLAERVFVFDNLHPQVHGTAPVIPSWGPDAVFIRGDVADRESLDAAVSEAAPELVMHFAAETGTGQSADEPARHCQVNVTGTALLLEALRDHAPDARRVFLASSRAVYGEGPYLDADARLVFPRARSTDDLKEGRFAPRSDNGGLLTPQAVSCDTARPNPSSVYGASKLMQEYLVQQALRRGEWTILRFQNVYGPGQSMKNSYTGVLSIFCQQILMAHELNIFEDGDIVRDFVYIDDVIEAVLSACFVAEAAGQIYDIGSGMRTTILDAAKSILAYLGIHTGGYRITGDFRPGDVRFALADISKARRTLGWEPRTTVEQGLRELACWATTQVGVRPAAVRGAM